MPLPRNLRLQRTVGNSSLMNAQGPGDLGLLVSSQILSELLLDQPGRCGGVRTGFILDGWILMNWWQWGGSGQRKKLSLHEVVLGSPEGAKNPNQGLD